MTVDLQRPIGHSPSDDPMATEPGEDGSGDYVPTSTQNAPVDLPTINTPDPGSPVRGASPHTPPNGQLNGFVSPERDSSRASSVADIADRRSPLGYNAPKHPSNMSPRSSVFDIQKPQRLTSAMSVMSSRLVDRSRLSSSSLLMEKGLLETEGPLIPWEIIRWTQLPDIGESAYNQYGRLTCMTIRGAIAVGTQLGYCLIFDYRQRLKATLGVEFRKKLGEVRAVSLAAGYSFVAAGYASGDILVWDITQPAKVYRHFEPAVIRDLAQSRAEDKHVKGRSIIMLDFMGATHDLLLSADQDGIVISHSLSRQLLTVSSRSTRLLGRFPSSMDEFGNLTWERKVNPILDMASLPLGSMPFTTDYMRIFACLTPSRVGIRINGVQADP